MGTELDSTIYYIYKAINKKLGEDIVVLDIKNISPICDYFVIASGASTRQVKSIVDEIEDELSKQNVKLLRREGYDSGNWVLLDYGDIVVHIFSQEDRQFYNLEGIWKDADKIHIDVN